MSGYISKIVSVQLMMTNYSFVARWFHVWFGAIFLVTTLGILQSHSTGLEDDRDVDEWTFLWWGKQFSRLLCWLGLMLPLLYVCVWKLLEHLILAAEYGWHISCSCTSHRPVYVARIVMSICSRARLQQEQGQLTSWVTSSEENLLQNFSYIFVLDNFLNIRFLTVSSTFFSLLLFCHCPAGS